MNFSITDVFGPCRRIKPPREIPIPIVGCFQQICDFWLPIWHPARAIRTFQVHPTDIAPIPRAQAEIFNGKAMEAVMNLGFSP